MQIIIVDRHGSPGRRLTLGGRHLAAAALMATGTLAAAALVGASAASASPTAPVARPTPMPAAVEDAARRDELRQLAQRVAAMQAKMDTLEPPARAPAPNHAAPSSLPPLAQGGLLIPAREIAPPELHHALDRLNLRADDYLVQRAAPPSAPRAGKPMLGTAMPLQIGLVTSSFGVRTDPITGGQAVHEGQDFAAPAGAPILAAAAGVVLSAGAHPDYGLMVELDHGNALTTRYAHASRLMVRPGDLVRRGQTIAAVGSTGRSTGPHLHFEVRLDGVAIDPVRFLGPAARTALATRRR